MKTSFRIARIWIATLALAAIILSFAMPIRAGLKNSYDVSITGPDSTINQAYEAKGALGSARNSADSNQQIGCSIGVDLVSYPGQGITTFRGLSCTARNAAGKSVSCYVPTSSAWKDTWEAFAQVVGAIGPQSSMYFKAVKAQNGEYICNNIWVGNSSDQPLPVN